MKRMSTLKVKYLHVYYNMHVYKTNKIHRKEPESALFGFRVSEVIPENKDPRDRSGNQASQEQWDHRADKETG